MSSAAGLSSYYVAVGHQEAKLASMYELLCALQLPGRKLSTIVCCSARDALDEVVCALLEDPAFAVTVLHADLTDKEREFQVSNFKRMLVAQAETGREGNSSGMAQQGGSTPAQVVPAGQAPTSTEHAPPSSAAGTTSVSYVEHNSLVLVTTDVCLKALPRDLLPLGANLLIHFDMATKKDTLMRRISSVFGGVRERRGGGGVNISIHLLVAGEAAAFRTVEKLTAPAGIAEMPVHVADVFAR